MHGARGLAGISVFRLSMGSICAESSRNEGEEEEEEEEGGSWSVFEGDWMDLRSSKLTYCARSIRVSGSRSRSVKV